MAIYGAAAAKHGVFATNTSNATPADAITSYAGANDASTNAYATSGAANGLPGYGAYAAFATSTRASN